MAYNYQNRKKQTEAKLNTKFSDQNNLRMNLMEPPIKPCKDVVYAVLT